MENTMGNEGANLLVSVLQERMHNMMDKPEVLDFGVIQEDLSLLTNRFPKPIPRKDYMVCASPTSTGVAFRPGYRVLVAWVGDDACVVSTIRKA